MQYKVDEYHDLVGRDFFFTLDGDLVPICQFADTQTGVVEFAAMTDDYRVYFDFDREDYPILKRSGNLEIHIIENGATIASVLGSYIKAGAFLRPFPYEITEGMKACGEPLWSPIN